MFRYRNFFLIFDILFGLFRKVINGDGTALAKYLRKRGQG